jgi:hypothetical protein
MAMDSTRRGIALGLAVLLVIGFLALYVAVWMNRLDPVMTTLVIKNFAAIVGLPAAATASFVVVTLLRQAERPIEFEGLGFKFRGASGEIVLWICCFLASAGAIRLLWNNPT